MKKISIIKTCIYCKKEYNGTEKQKFCSPKCSQLNQKGLKKPHSEEWEKNRLDAVRKNSWKLQGRVSESSKETIKTAQVALKEWQKNNPEEVRKHALANMPKDCSKEKNGNWRNGATELNYNWRTANLTKLNQWRKKVLKKNCNKCMLCGSTEKLEAHHIVSLMESKLSAFELWNGVTLCRSCHQKTSSWGCSKKEDESDKSEGLDIIIKQIPPIFQEYETWGNYKKIENTTYFLISDHGNDFFTKLTLIHEIIEYTLLEYKDANLEALDKFDIEFEKDPKRVEMYSEPGNDPECPYKKEHEIAEIVARMMCMHLGVDYELYNNCM